MRCRHRRRRSPPAARRHCASPSSCGRLARGARASERTLRCRAPPIAIKLLIASREATSVLCKSFFVVVFLQRQDAARRRLVRSFVSHSCRMTRLRSRARMIAHARRKGERSNAFGDSSRESFHTAVAYFLVFLTFCRLCAIELFEVTNFVQCANDRAAKFRRQKTIFLLEIVASAGWRLARIYAQTMRSPSRSV